MTQLAPIRPDMLLVLGDSHVVPHFSKHRFLHIGKKRRSDLQLLDCRLLTLPAKFDVEEYERETDKILALCDELFQQYGRPARVIANSEHTILVGAQVRDAFSIPGRGEAEVAPLRNKFLMKRKIREAGYLDVGHFIGSEPDFTVDTEHLARLFPSASFPVVIKPASQAASRHVYVKHNMRDLLKTMDIYRAEKLAFLIEPFIGDPIIHVDGLMRGGELSFLAPSRYVEDCFSWHNYNTPMSSALISDALILLRIRDFTEKVLRSLQAHDMVFHLELFMSNTNGDLHFLEIAARPGGAAIVPALKGQFGIDLHRENFLIDMGQESDFFTPAGWNPLAVLNKESITSGATGGWIVFPLQERGPCEVREVIYRSEELGNVIWTEFCQVGDRFNEHYFEDPAVGKFAFVAESDKHAAETLECIKASFSVRTRPIQ